MSSMNERSEPAARLCSSGETSLGVPSRPKNHQLVNNYVNHLELPGTSDHKIRFGCLSRRIAATLGASSFDREQVVFDDAAFETDQDACGQEA